MATIKRDQKVDDVEERLPAFKFFLCRTYKRRLTIKKMWALKTVVKRIIIIFIKYGIVFTIGYVVIRNKNYLSLEILILKNIVNYQLK